MKTKRISKHLVSLVSWPMISDSLNHFTCFRDEENRLLEARFGLWFQFMVSFDSLYCRPSIRTEISCMKLSSLTLRKCVGYCFNKSDWSEYFVKNLELYFDSCVAFFSFFFKTPKAAMGLLSTVSVSARVPKKVYPVRFSPPTPFSLVSTLWRTPGKVVRKTQT